MKGIKLLFYFLFLILFSSELSAQQGSWIWATEGVGDADVFSLATDLKGNCYVAGLIENDTVYFDSYTIMNSTVTNAPYTNDYDAYLVKITPQGKIIWATQTFEKNSKVMGGNDAPEYVCTDNKDNVYLAGNFIDTLFIQGDTLITSNSGYNPQNTYLAKYNSIGEGIWSSYAKCINDSSLVSMYGVSTDNMGGIYITGVFKDTISFGSSKVQSFSPTIIDAFLVKYDSNGNVLWARQSTGHTSFGVVSFVCTADKNGNSFITGKFEDTAIFGSYKLSSSLSNGVFYIAKYDPAGNVLWAKQSVNSSFYSEGTGFALVSDKEGNIYAGGDFIDTIVFGQDTVISPQSSFFLTKYDLNGNVIWAKNGKVLDANQWGLWSLSVDTTNHIYLSANESGGNQQCKIVFGGDTISLIDTAVL